MSNFFKISDFIVFCLVLFLLVLLIFFGNHPLPLLPPEVGRGRKEGIWRPIILWGVFLFLGVWRFQVALPDYNDVGKIYHYNNQSIKFIGLVSSVDERIDKQKLTIKSFSLPSSGGEGGEGSKINGNVLVNSGLYPKYNYGDTLEINCTLERPQKFEDFDYEKYLARYNIYSVCAFAKINVGTGRDPSLQKRIVSMILNFKNKLLDGLSKSINEPQVSILQAMILGQRSGIPQALLDKFANTGITHIIAISGMNITIIVVVLMYLLINFGIIRQKAFWLASAGILIFILMIGDQASALRAAIMGIVLLYAQKIGRLNNSINAIIFAAAVMLLINPKLLLSDIGFQLSFAAIMGMIYLVPIFKKYFEKLPNRWQLKEIIITTISAQIMTLPLIIFYFHKFSLVSILTNAFILPIIPFLTIWGLVNALVSTFSLWLGQVMGFVSYLGISYLLWVVDWSLKIPLAYLENIYFNGLMLVGLYGIIFRWVYRSRVNSAIIIKNN